MKTMTVFLLLFSTLTAHAQLTADYRFGEQIVPFAVLDEGRLVVSQACVDSRGVPASSCKAMRAWSRAGSEARRVKTRSGGFNPSSALCSGLGGEVIIGADVGRNQQSFCTFDDQSMVSTDSLLWRVRLGHSASE